MIQLVIFKCLNKVSNIHYFEIKILTKVKNVEMQ